MEYSEKTDGAKLAAHGSASERSTINLAGRSAIRVLPI
jgi:hypothetical protein